jgi:tetratricopeptide (TPR) repeat protein
MKKWEYKVLETSPGLTRFDELDKLGKEGWELVAAITKTEIGITDGVLFIFKREEAINHLAEFRDKKQIEKPEGVELTDKEITGLLLLFGKNEVPKGVEEDLQLASKLIKDSELDAEVVEEIKKANPHHPFFWDIKNSEDLKFRFLATGECINGDYGKAIKYANKALEINPNSHWLIFIRGCAMGANGKFEESIKDLNKAIELEPKFLNAYGARKYIEKIIGSTKEMETIEEKSKSRTQAKRIGSKRKS